LAATDTATWLKKCASCVASRAAAWRWAAFSSTPLREAHASSFADLVELQTK
jgi:hypothetical protein